MRSTTEQTHDPFPLPTRPEDVIPSQIKRFNSGDVNVFMDLYAPDVVFVMNDGQAITDRAAITARIERDIELGLPLVANVRHVYVAGDIAQLIVDWSIEGKLPDGKEVGLSGSACDIVRRGADGFWRTIIDNNQGTAVRQPA